MKPPLRILVAPNAFRDNLKATEAADSIKEGLLAALPEASVFVLPVADGGDGSFDTICSVKNPDILMIRSKDPLQRDIDAEIAFLSPDTAFIEMAKFSGLNLLDPSERNPLITDTFGTGIAIGYAIDKGCSEIYLAVGGSGTTDAGTGILHALGFHFINSSGGVLPAGGAALNELEEIVIPSDIDRLKKVKIKILCDVKNPLLGENGTARVFAPQKGADKTGVEFLEKAMQHFSALIQEQTGKDIRYMPYGGAAGGIPAGLSPFLNIELLPGAETILNILNFSSYLDISDLVITAEGRLDHQSIQGKAPFVVAEKAVARGKPVIFIGGSIPASISGADYNLFTAVFSIAPGPADLGESMANASQWLKRVSFNIGRTLKAGSSFYSHRPVQGN